MTIEIRDQDKLREGEQIGQRNQSIKIAMAMFQDGLPLETVQKYTKILSTKELEEIQTRVQNGENIEQ